MPRRSKDSAGNAAEKAIEEHVACQVRLRRGLLGMTQSDLAKALGITFQQVQKYERGSNRISVGKLYRLSDILGVPITYFFDGLEVEAARPPTETNDVSGILSRRELDLVRAWRQAPPEVSDAVSGLLRSVAPDGALSDIPTLAYVPLAPLAEETPASSAIEPGTEAPRRRGRPPGLGAKSKGQGGPEGPGDKPGQLPPAAARAAPLQGDRARRRTPRAVWDPADIRDYGDEG